MKEKPLSQWQLEGWAAAMWFPDAARSRPAAALTRACVEGFRPEPYTAHGLLLPVPYEHLAQPPKERRTCLSVPAGRAPRGGPPRGHGCDCFTVPQLAYRP